MNTEQKEIKTLLQHLQLGVDNRPLAADNSHDLRLVCIHMAQQAKRSIHIVSRHMDNELYDNTGFIDALTQLIRRSKYTNIQILVQDSSPAVKNGHRLINLAQQLSSYVKIKQLHSDYKEYNRAFMIADEQAFILREAADRYEAKINYYSPLEARELLKSFTEAWEISEPDSQLRRLYM